MNILGDIRDANFACHQLLSGDNTILNVYGVCVCVCECVLCMFICVYMCLYMCIYVHVCVYMHACACMHVCVYLCAHSHMSVSMYAHVFLRFRKRLISVQLRFPSFFVLNIILAYNTNKRKTDSFSRIVVFKKWCACWVS